MEKGETVKDRIILVTTELIEQHNGNTKSITARMIAEKAGIGLGLINYHFGSKDHLIMECVQRIIGKVIADFRMEQEFHTDKERLTTWAIYVFDFLFEHAAISRISILGDLEDYTEDCNSVSTQDGLMRALKSEIWGEKKSMLVFTLTSAMQAAFLGSKTIGRLLGYDFAKPEDRAAYIKKLVDVLFEKTVRQDE